MAILQEIKVPLISVNDTSLTVVELIVQHGDKIQKGDAVMVFETSKTTYDVAAESDGYIEVLCEAGKDYEVNDVVAKIHSKASDVPIAFDKPLLPVKNAFVEIPVWEGEV